MFYHLLKALLLTLVVCQARRNLQEQLCENGTPIYELYIIDGTYPTEKVNCTYGVTIESGQCRVILNDVKADSTGHICFNAVSGECKEIDTKLLTGSVSSHCGDDSHTEPIKEIQDFEFNKQIPIETSILKMNVAAGYGCEGEKAVPIWGPEECKPTTEEKNETDEKKEEDNKNDPEENNQTENKNTTEPENNTTEPTEPEKNEVDPEKNVTEPEKNNTEPEKNEVEPEKNGTEPGKNEADNKNVTEPETNEQDKNLTENPPNNNNNTEPNAQNNDTKETPNEKSFSTGIELGLLELVLGLFLFA